MSIFSKKLVDILLVSLLFPALILAQEPDGILLTGLFTDSRDTHEQEILQDIKETFNVELVLTYDQTDIITGPLAALATKKDIASPVNGLEDPLLSKISGYQKKTIAHSAGVITAVSLAKQGKLWGEELYLVSPPFTSQDDLRVIRDLHSQGKGFSRIVLYTGDDMIPDFKKVYINFKNYSNEIWISEILPPLSIEKVIYENRKQEVDLLRTILDSHSNLIKEKLGKAPLSATIYGAEPGNKFEIEWEDGTKETFYLQKDVQTGHDFQDEEGITNIPIYDGLPHGQSQLEDLAKFYKTKRSRMPENNKDDIAYFKQSIQKATTEILTAADPNELLVSPIGNVKPGDTLNYTINYENEGEGIAFGVYITDTLEEDLDDSTLTVNNGGIYDSKTRTITWFIGELQSKQKGSVSFSVNVRTDAQDNSEVINFATVYFPSVPETTRTNGTVNRITTLIDNIPPAATASISPLPNQNGWNNSDVTVTLTAQDNQGGSGVSKTEYSFDNTNWIIYATPFTITNEGTTTLYYKSTDNTGNTESAKTLTIKIDKTSPTITSIISPQPNPYGWNNTDVTVTFVAQDNLSGIASLTQPITITTEGANQYIGGQAIDLAGNSASTSVTLSIDKTPPELIITLPQEQAGYILKQLVLSGWQVTDSLSGIASVESTTPSGQVIDTSSPGGKTFNVSVRDKADNQKALSVTYKVIYTFSGILPPVESSGTSVFKLGSTIPVKFYLKDAQGNFVANAVGKLSIQKFSDNIPSGEPIEAVSTGSSTTGNLFRYDTIDNQYIFNLSTKTLSTGLWQLRIELDDTEKYTVFVGLK